jgi:integrase
MKARGKKGKPLSINTVIMYLCHLQTILDKAGPPARRNRDAAGYIPIVPWVKIPRESLGEATIVSEESLARCYEAAALMPRPRPRSALFWRALLIVGRYFGLRARTLFSMEWKHVEWEKRRVVLPAALLKGRKVLVLPIPDVVAEHLAAIQRDDGPVFNWPHSREMFRRDFHLLQTLAGVDWFGLHTLRRTAITKMWATSPAAAQLLAGHGSPIITRMSYVNVEDVLTDAMADVGSFASIIGTAKKTKPVTDSAVLVLDISPTEAQRLPRAKLLAGKVGAQ